MAPPDRNPAYVFGFLLVLGVPQILALGEQVRRGYRPFTHVPVRVPLSWDMFSTSIDRCGLRWDPPVNARGHRLASLREAGTALEWDPVYDRVEDYALAAEVGCSGASPGTVAHLRCFTHEGRELTDAIRCR